MDSIIAKIQMLGSKVIAHNSFGVVYETQSGDKELIKVTYTLDGQAVKTNRIKDFWNYDISEHFIYLQFDTGRNQCAIYIKTSDKNILARNKRVLLYYEFKGFTVLDGGLGGKTPVILYETINRRVYALNYLGNKFEVTKYKPEDVSYSFNIQVSSDGTRVKIGYGARFNSTTGKYLAYLTSDMIDWYIDTDIGFKDIIYKGIQN